MNVKVEVKRKHIKAGAIMCPFLCPIARALKATFPAHRPVVTVSSIDIQDSQLNKKTLFARSTSSKVQEFIQAFDAGKEVEPFSFTLYNVPAKFLEKSSVALLSK